jgi:hypothetical protein
LSERGNRVPAGVVSPLCGTAPRRQ